MAVALAASAAACGSTPSTIAYLGPIENDAGTADAADAAPDQQQPPQPTAMTTTECPSAVLVGSDEASVVRSVSVLGDRAFVASAGTVSAWDVLLGNSDAGGAGPGCPTTRISSFGTSGQLALDASSVAAAPGGRAIAATADGLLVLSATGDTVGRCQLAGADIVARSVAMDPDGKGVAVFARSPLYVISSPDPANPGVCTASAIAIDSEPFAIAAAAPRQVPQGTYLVTVQQSRASAPLVVAWYDDVGSSLGTSEAWSADGQPGHLCSAIGLVATDSAVFVADGACHRLVAFDSTTHAPIEYATFDGTPRGVAIASTGQALVAVAAPHDDGATATFWLASADVAAP